MPERIELHGSGPLAKKRKRYRDDSPQTLDTLPMERRELLCRWLKRGGNSRWETLAKDAGTAYPLAQTLLEWLLQAGWIVVTEERRAQAWWPVRIEFRHVEQLRAALGLPDPIAARQAWENAAQIHFEDSELAGAATSLAQLPPTRALTRLHLLKALAQWRFEQRSGTRRDFAWFVRGDTKGISDAEWNWLAEQLDLDHFNLSNHTPHLLLAAPVTLVLNKPARLELDASPDWLGLTPATLADIAYSERLPNTWLLVENRTSFERLARRRSPQQGVLWLPGYPPTWWREAVEQLLSHAPAPAEIACDPDPAGIAITLQAAAVWESANLSWKTPNMTAAQLLALPHRKPLSTADITLLSSLLTSPLPDTLQALANTMLELGEKGEQEAYL